MARTTYDVHTRYACLGEACLTIDDATEQFERIKNALPPGESLKLVRLADGDVVEVIREETK